MTLRLILWWRTIWLLDSCATGSSYGNISSVVRSYNGKYCTYRALHETYVGKKFSEFIQPQLFSGLTLSDVGKKFKVSSSIFLDFLLSFVSAIFITSSSLLKYYRVRLHMSEPYSQLILLWNHIGVSSMLTFAFPSFHEYFDKVLAARIKLWKVRRLLEFFISRGEG